MASSQSPEDLATDPASAAPSARSASTGDPAAKRMLGILDLPAEVRVILYRMIFVKGNIEIPSSSPVSKTFRTRAGASAQFLRCNKVFLLEGRPILYGENNFWFTPNRSDFGRFFQLTGKAAKNYVRTIGDLFHNQLNKTRVLEITRYVKQLQRLHLRIEHWVGVSSNLEDLEVEMKQKALTYLSGKAPFNTLLSNFPRAEFAITLAFDSLPNLVSVHDSAHRKDLDFDIVRGHGVDFSLAPTIPCTPRPTISNLDVPDVE